MKIDTRTNLHFRTIWSMPMPTARRSSTYEQFMQPGYQLSQQTCFDFLRSELNYGQKCANTQVNNNVSTEQQKELFDLSAAEALITNSESNKVSIVATNTTENPSGTENTSSHRETDFNKTAINASDNADSRHVNTNDNQKTSDILLMKESNNNSLIEVHNRMAKDNQLKKLEVETPNDFNLIGNACNNVSVPIKSGKGKGKAKKKKSKIEIGEPPKFIGEPINEWKNETFSLGDIVEVCAGDWIGLTARITAIDGGKITVIGCIDGVELAKPFRFTAGQLCSYAKANQNEEKIVSLDKKESAPEAVQSNDNNNENEGTNIDTYESDTLKEDAILDESSSNDNNNENEGATIVTDESGSLKEDTILDESSSNDSNNENEGTIIDTYQSDTLTEETILDESSTQVPNVATLEADDNLQKSESNVLTKRHEDVIIGFSENKKVESCDSVKLISIEDIKSNIEPEFDENDENIISIESGQGLCRIS